MPDGVRLSLIGPYLFACDRPAGATLIGHKKHTMADNWLVHGGSDFIQSKASTSGPVERSVTAILGESVGSSQSD